MRKIYAVVLCFTIIFAFASFACSASIYMPTFNYDTALYQALPIDYSFSRTNGNTYYYECFNIVSSNSFFNNDSNLNYRVNDYNSVNNTPFGYYDYGSVSDIKCVNVFRRAGGSASYAVGYTALSGLYENGFILSFLPDIYVRSTSSGNYNCLIDYRLSFLYNDRFVSVTSAYVTPITYYGTGEGDYIYYLSPFGSVVDSLYNKGYDLENIGKISIDYITVQSIDFADEAGIWAWFGNSMELRYPYISITNNSFVGISEAFSILPMTFTNITRALSVEILPGFSILSIVGTACVIGVTIKVLRSV